MNVRSFARFDRVGAVHRNRADFAASMTFGTCWKLVSRWRLLRSLRTVGYNHDDVELAPRNHDGLHDSGLAQVFHAFDARCHNRSIFTSRLFTNGWLWGAVAICLILQVAAVYLPLLQKVLRTVSPTALEWGVIADCSLLPVAVVELVKLITRAAYSKNNGITKTD